MQDETTPNQRKTKCLRRQITADPHAAQWAAALNGMLVEPVSVLPRQQGDLVRPWRVGIGAEFKARVRVDVDSKAFHTAMHRYTHSAAYLLALLQDGAIRYDIAGNPVESVSDNDRKSAKKNFAALQARRKQRRQEPVD